MTMMRKEARGAYQIGIYAVVRDPLPATRTGAIPPWLATSGTWRQRFHTLAAAYLFLTGEPLRNPKTGEKSS